VNILPDIKPDDEIMAREGERPSTSSNVHRRRRLPANDAETYSNLPWKQLSKSTRVALPLDTPSARPNVLLGRNTDFIYGDNHQIDEYRNTVFNKKQDRQEQLRRTLRRRFLDLDPYEMFASFDKNGNGRLTRDELRLGITLVGMELLHDEFNYFFDKAEKNTYDESSLRSLETQVNAAWKNSEQVDTVDAYQGVMIRQQKRNEKIANQKTRRDRKLMHARAVRHQKQANRKDVPPTVRNCLMRMEEKEQKRQLKKNLKKAAERSAIVKALQASALFAGLPNTLMNEVAQASTKTKLHFGDFIVRQGDEANSLICIIEGAAMLSECDGESSLATVVEMGSGDLLGEGVLYEENGIRTADVRVKEENGLFLVALDRDLLRSLCNKFPMFSARVKQQGSDFDMNGFKTFRRQHNKQSTTKSIARRSVLVPLAQVQGAVKAHKLVIRGGQPRPSMAGRRSSATTGLGSVAAMGAVADSLPSL
jgi:CRP-like cAMP-binding protein